MTTNSLYYLVDSALDNVLSNKCNELRILVREARQKLCRELLNLGCSEYLLNRNGTIHCVKFQEGKTPPVGFTKPKKNGESRPRANSIYATLFDELKLPDTGPIMRELLNCPTHLNYCSATTNVRGSILIGDYVKPIGLYWYNATDNFLLMVPNVKLFVDELNGNHGEKLVYENDADSWQMSTEFCRQILIEEWNFIVAKYDADNSEAQHGKH